MGLLDHKKEWQFELEASPDDCIETFISTLNNRKLGKIKQTGKKRSRGSTNVRVTSRHFRYILISIWNIF